MGIELVFNLLQGLVIMMVNIQQLALRSTLWGEVCFLAVTAKSTLKGNQLIEVVVYLRILKITHIFTSDATNKLVLGVMDGI